PDFADSVSLLTYDLPKLLSNILILLYFALTPRRANLIPNVLTAPQAMTFHPCKTQRNYTKQMRMSSIKPRNLFFYETKR
ncbi:MAG: hypothetical protein OEL66_04125, partial [Desulfobulbaceae bacterium]|nr:hypothetical protein [Desulfobulbaceae bacterium]